MHWLLALLGALVLTQIFLFFVKIIDDADWTFAPPNREPDWVTAHRMPGYIKLRLFLIIVAAIVALIVALIFFA
jgi:hypothetical protein